MLTGVKGDGLVCSSHISCGKVWGDSCIYRTLNALVGV